MEGIEKKDMLNLDQDSFVRSILLPKGKFRFTWAIKPYRGSILLLLVDQVQQLWHETNKNAAHY